MPTVANLNIFESPISKQNSNHKFRIAGYCSSFFMLICGQKRGPFDKATLEQLSGALSALLEAQRVLDLVHSESTLWVWVKSYG